MLIAVFTAITIGPRLFYPLQNKSGSINQTNRQILQASSIILYPVEDAYVDTQYAAQNFGTTTTIKLDDTPKRYGFIKFDDSIFWNAQVISAKLRIKTLVTFDGIISVRDVVDTNPGWTETKITYANRPDFTETLAKATDGIAGTWLEFDLTAAVNKNSGKMFSIQLMTGSGKLIEFPTKETGIDQPELVVTYDPSAVKIPPTPFPTPPPFVLGACSASASDIMIAIDISGSMFGGGDIIQAQAAYQHKAL